MPTLPNAAGVAKVEMRYVLANGANAVNVLHFKRPTGGAYSAAQMGLLIAEVADWWNNGSAPGVNLQVYQSNRVALTEIWGTDLTSTSGVQVIGTVGLDGTNVNEPLPGQCAVVVTHRTTTRGRSFRGRTYIPGLTEGLSNPDGLLDPGDIAAFLDIFDNLDTRVAGLADPVSMVVLSYYSAGALRATPIATSVASHTCDPYIDTQRRRAKP